MGKNFTLVFEGDIRDFGGNPFKTETPFGKPCAVRAGDAIAAVDEAEELVDAMKAMLTGGFETLDDLKREIAREDFVVSSPPAPKAKQ